LEHENKQSLELVSVKESAYQNIKTKLNAYSNKIINNQERIKELTEK